MANNIKLKPCPKCGSRKALYHYVPQRPGNNWYWHPDMVGKPVCSEICPLHEHVNVVCIRCNFRWWVHAIGNENKAFDNKGMALAATPKGT